MVISYILASYLLEILLLIIWCELFSLTYLDNNKFLYACTAVVILK